MSLLKKRPASEMDEDVESLKGSKVTEGGTRRCKLPKLELPKFKGELRDWLPFWSQFAKIHEDQSLTNADKLHYLHQSTVAGSLARDIVCSFPLTDANYSSVVESLKQRFGREDLLVQVYVRDLLSLVMENIQKRERSSISQLYLKLSAQLRALEVLKVTKDKCAAILYLLVESCIPEEMLRTWERHRLQLKATSSELELEGLMEFLQNEVRGEEHLKLAKIGFGSNTGEKNFKQRTGITPAPLSYHKRQPTAAVLFSGENERKVQRQDKCVFCDGNHASHDCWSAQKLTMDQKKDLIRKKGRCFKCLRHSNHVAAQCRIKVSCTICGKYHYAIMCNKNNTPQAKDATPRSTLVSKAIMPNKEIESSEMAALSGRGDVQLQTLVLKIFGPHGTRNVRALFDSASQKSYVTKKLAKELQLEEVGLETVVHQLFGGQRTEPKHHIKYKLKVGNLKGDFQFYMTVSDSVRIARLGLVPKGGWIQELNHRGIKLSDLKNRNEDVELLIGADVYGKLMTGRKVELNAGPVALETFLGWTVIGQATEGQLHTVVNMMNSEELKNFWELDVLGIRDPPESISKKELTESARKHFDESVCRLPDGRYEVNLPWISGHTPLASNRDQAISRLRMTTGKLLQNGKIKDYDLIFKEWLAMGIIEKVPKEELDTYAYFMPHRPVFKPSSLTTPIRPVFDASAKCKGNVSLNDCLETGPNMLELIPDILTRFRLHKYGVVADIKKAFLQISVEKRDRDFLRFLWYDDVNKMDWTEFRHNRVVFGVKSSPWLLAASLNCHLGKAVPEMKEAAEILMSSLYVDNVVASVDSEEKVLRFQREANNLLLQAQFELRGWELGSKTTTEKVAVLGILWEGESDTLLLDIKIDEEELGPVTKRKILSHAHKIYDPLGVTWPFTIFPRILLHEVWSLKVGWDKPLPIDICEKFDKWYKQVQELKDYKIPRWLNPNCLGSNHWSLHIFVDASGSCYSCVAFLRIGEYNDASVSFVLARCRVAPVKQMTIPRLELMACLIGARLLRSINNALQQKMLPYYLWSDSSTALTWITKQETTWAPFVQNRVVEIRKLTSIESWKFVPGEMNIADVPTRYCSVKKLKSLRWHEGPKWLKNKYEWPDSSMILSLGEVEEEKRKTVTSCTDTVEVPWYLVRFSNFNKLVRVRGWLRRFCHNCKRSIHERNLDVDLSLEEVLDSEKTIIGIIQLESFNGAADPNIRNLRPMVDEDGLLRVETKIILGDEESLVKMPYLLPSKHELVIRLIRWLHLQSLHPGVQTLQMMLRERFWIVKSRRTIGYVVSACQRCRRFSARNFENVRPPLPRDRIIPGKIWETVGVDAFGPLILRDGNKAWVILYTCAVYRAVHMELVSTLSTEGFLQTLRRFIARRGRMSKIYCDNGTNFRGAYNLFKLVDWGQVEKYAKVKRIHFIFSAPISPQWGGFFERMVGVVKVVLRKVLGNASISFEEMITLLAEVESVVNHRPLTYISDDINDLQPLMPALFLQELPATGLPEADVSDGNSLTKRLRHLQNVRDALKTRFRKEYLTQLVHKERIKATRSIEVGEVVLIGNNNLKRLEWPIGLVEKVIKGKDGKIRVAVVKTQTGSFTRSIQRLYPLEISAIPNNDDESEKEAEVTLEPEVKTVDEVRTRSGRLVKSPQRLDLLFSNL